MKTSLLPTLLNEKDQALMILIYAGKYLVGKKELSTRVTLSDNKSTFVDLAAFYIDRTEITVAQFLKYHPAYNEKPFIGGKDCPNCPAMGINWIQASKYCRWAPSTRRRMGSRSTRCQQLHLPLGRDVSS